MFGRNKSVQRATKAAARSVKKANAKAAKSAAKANAKTAASAQKANAATARSVKKANAKTAKANARTAKADTKLIKADTKAVKLASKAANKAAKAEAKAAKTLAKEPPGLIGALTNPKTARRAMAVAKIAGPTIAPYALRAATSTRGYLDQRRAIRLGVRADQVAAYRGPTGPAGARIASLRTAVDELRRRRVADLQATRFADVAKARLADLDIAVSTAGSMPPARRRGTLVAVGRELNQIEADLMSHLVGATG